MHHIEPHDIKSEEEEFKTNPSTYRLRPKIERDMLRAMEDLGIKNKNTYINMAVKAFNKSQGFG